jgi:hypothetical protein
MTYERRLEKAKKHVAKLNADERWALWQALAGDGHRFYGDGGTIHQSGTLDVCQDAHEVTQVWFRCQNLPFRVSGGRSDVINPNIGVSGVVVSDRNF